MPFNVSTFKQNISTYGIIQDNKYDFSVNFGFSGPVSTGSAGLPSAAISSSKIQTSVGPVTMSTLAADLSNRSILTSLPSFILRPTNVNRYGLGLLESMPFTGMYSDLPVTFLADSKGGIYNFFYNWMSFIFTGNGQAAPDGVSNQITRGNSYYTMEYKSNYAATITIKVYDNAGNVSMTHNFYNAFPISLNETSVSWESTNKLMKLSVTFSYKEWKMTNSTLTSQ